MHQSSLNLKYLSSAILLGENTSLNKKNKANAAATTPTTTKRFPSQAFFPPNSYVLLTTKALAPRFLCTAKFAMTWNVSVDPLEGFEQEKDVSKLVYDKLQLTQQTYAGIGTWMYPYNFLNCESAAVLIHTIKCSLSTPSSGETTMGYVS